MKKAQEGPFGERIETDPTVRGIKVRTQRTLADSMLINPDVNSMDSRG